MSSPKKNVAYVFYVGLIDSAASGSFRSNPTIAAGDFKTSKDGAAFANLATLPVVDPASSVAVKISLSQTEMNGDKIVVTGIDAAGAQWDDVLVFIDATTANVDDLVRATTPANTLDVAATGEAGLDLNNTVGTLAAAQFAANFLTAAKIAASALDGKGDWNVGKTGYALSAAGVDLVWDELKAGHTVANSFGDFLDIEVSGRAVAGDAMALTAAAVNLIWDEAMTETTGAPAVTASFREALKWMFALSRNKITQTPTLTTLRNDADAADLATSVVSDAASLYTRGKWSV